MKITIRDFIFLFLTIWCAALSYQAFEQNRTQPIFYSLDINELLQEFTQRAVQNEETLDEEASKKFTEQLNQLVKNFDREQNVVIFVKPAVVSGGNIYDLTQKFRNKLFPHGDKK